MAQRALHENLHTLSRHGCGYRGQPRAQAPASVSEPPMQPSLSATEQFLTDFHDRQPGVTSAAYGTLAVRRGALAFASSYESLAAEVGATDLRVLDLACGDGFLLSLLQARTPSRLSLSGVDLSAGELAAAQQRLKGAAHLCCCRAQALPMADAAFDHVVCHMALMLMDDLESVLREVRRVLGAGGKFSFVVGASPAADQPVLAAYVSRLRALLSGDASRYLRFGDARLRSADGVRQALDPCFTTVSIEELSLSRRYTPAQLWQWFEGMYDLAFLTPSQQAHFKSDYLAEIEPLCDADGRLELTDTLRQVGALAA